MRFKRPKTTLTRLIFFLGFIFFLHCQDETAEDTIQVHEILGQLESCWTCHQEMKGFSPSHNPEIIGCTPCHLGNPHSADKVLAHEDMVLIPGNFADMNMTCGALNCHSQIIPKVENSLMSTMAGVITVDRFTFGESDTLSQFSHVNNLTKNTAADVHLRQLCASCHLGNEKTATGPIHEMSRGGGCNACHLTYDSAAIFDHERYHSGGKTIVPGVHAKLSVVVQDDHCFGCHSRSGRISTNYQGWHETTLTEHEMPEGDQFRLLEDGRVFSLIQPDVHYEAGLTCIDCHSSAEVMGDGNIYLHQEEAVKIRCIDCHQKSPGLTVTYEALDQESKKLMALRNWSYQDQDFVLASKSQKPLYNVMMGNRDSIFVIGKNTNGKHFAPKPAGACTKGNAHNALTCQTCHSGWAPQCVGCHHTFEKETFAVDLLDHEKVQGKWVEHIGEFFSDLPTLGVVEQTIDGNEVRTIKTFVSGMIMSIDKNGFSENSSDSVIFHRLYAPLDAHTTTTTARNCKSCHMSSLALGYGRGTLTFDETANLSRWQFAPEYVTTPYDGLPQDAWIGFQRPSPASASTRPNARPLSADEQYKVLTVGACLSCHDEQSSVMQNSLEDFRSILKQRTTHCTIPDL